jgi:hypothetical protein
MYTGLLVLFSLLSLSLQGRILQETAPLFQGLILIKSLKEKFSRIQLEVNTEDNRPLSEEIYKGSV